MVHFAISRVLWLIPTLFAMALVMAGPASAQVPLKKASDIVHAFVQDGQPCPDFPSSEDGFSHRVLPDGTLEPFVVPNKRVLIIRHFEIATSGATPGATRKARRSRLTS